MISHIKNVNRKTVSDFIKCNFCVNLGPSRFAKCYNLIKPYVPLRCIQFVKSLRIHSGFKNSTPTFFTMPFSTTALKYFSGRERRVAETFIQRRRKASALASTDSSSTRSASAKEGCPRPWEFLSHSRCSWSDSRWDSWWTCRVKWEFQRIAILNNNLIKATRCDYDVSNSCVSKSWQFKMDSVSEYPPFI